MSKLLHMAAVFVTIIDQFIIFTLAVFCREHPGGI